MHPTLFHLGPLPIRSYGVMVLIGFLLGLWYATSRARQLHEHHPDDKGIPSSENVFDYAIAALVLAIIGARVLYVLLDYSEFRGHPIDMLKTWTGGMSIYGSIVVGIAWTWIYCKRKGFRFGVLGDMLAPSFALGYAFGRIGCFLNGCCYGHACSMPWGVRFVSEGPWPTLTPPSHPTQLYATAFNLAWFALLHAWSKRRHPEGALFVGYLAMYSIYRYIDEEFRKGATASIMAFGLTHAQAFSLIVFPLAMIALSKMYARDAARRNGVSES